MEEKPKLRLYAPAEDEFDGEGCLTSAVVWGSMFTLTWLALMFLASVFAR